MKGPMGDYGGEITALNWRLLNKFLDKWPGERDRKKILAEFCTHYEIPRWRIEAELKTYRFEWPRLQ